MNWEPYNHTFAGRGTSVSANHIISVIDLQPATENSVTGLLGGLRVMMKSLVTMFRQMSRPWFRWLIWGLTRLNR